MNEIPEAVRTRLSDDCYRRAEPEAVKDVFCRLQVAPPEMMMAFYLAFRGPFFSRKTSYELLDIIEQEENVETATRTCRDEEFSFPSSALVLTNLNANAVLVCDVQTGGVYDVDFEGSDAEFIAGQLSARWKSFEAFLRFYFAQ